MKERNIMVCVTGQKTCEKLIKKAGELAEGKPIHVLHVISDECKFLNSENEGEALEYLFEVAKKYNSDMMVLKNNKVIDTIDEFAHENNITCIVLGNSPTNDENSFIYKLSKKITDIELHLVF